MGRKIFRYMFLLKTLQYLGTQLRILLPNKMKLVKLMNIAQSDEKETINVYQSYNTFQSIHQSTRID